MTLHYTHIVTKIYKPNRTLFSCGWHEHVDVKLYHLFTWHAQTSKLCLENGTIFNRFIIIRVGKRNKKNLSSRSETFHGRVMVWKKPLIHRLSFKLSSKMSSSTQLKNLVSQNLTKSEMSALPFREFFKYISF